MKVKELIALLSKFDGDLYVVVDHDTVGYDLKRNAGIYYARDGAIDYDERFQDLADCLVLETVV